MPAPGFKAAQLLLTKVNVAMPFSYGADIYLTPAGEELRTTDRGFRERCLADMLYFWKAYGHHSGNAGHTVDLIADVGKALQSLADTHAGEPVAREREHRCLCLEAAAFLTQAERAAARRSGSLLGRGSEPQQAAAEGDGADREPGRA